jgi:hypothetical protein
MKTYGLFLLMMPQILLARENLFTEKATEPPPPKREMIQSPNRVKTDSEKPVPPRGNLDFEILGKRSGYIADGAHVVIPAGKVAKTYPGLRVGDVIDAVVEESLFAFIDSKAPVRAKVISGRLKGCIFFGTASLEKNSKRIVIDFSTLIPKSKETYSVSAQALDTFGILGIEGEYKTEEAKFFTAEFLAAAAASYADASVERSQNALGNYVEAPGADTMGKKALGGALSKTAERFAEKVRQAPAYSVLQGPVVIRILVGG